MSNFGSRNVGAAGRSNGQMVNQDKSMVEAQDPVRRASNVIPFPRPGMVRGPVSIDFDLEHFADNWLPIATLAVAILAKDRTNLQLAVEQLGDASVRVLIDDLGYVEQKLLSIAEFARAAGARRQ
jgi:hypothetical protein